jgi:hypothetical protein
MSEYRQDGTGAAEPGRRDAEPTSGSRSGHSLLAGGYQEAPAREDDDTSEQANAYRRKPGELGKESEA